MIDSLEEAIDNHRPFSEHLAKSLHEKIVVEWTYNSNGRTARLLLNYGPFINLVAIS
jgi:Fic family protein